MASVAPVRPKLFRGAAVFARAEGQLRLAVSTCHAGGCGRERPQPPCRKHYEKPSESRSRF